MMGNTERLFGLLHVYLLALTEEVYGQIKVDLTPFPTATVTDNGSVELKCAYSRDGACSNDPLVFEWWLNDTPRLVLGWFDEKCIFGDGDSSLKFSCSSARDKCTFQLTLTQVNNSKHGEKWKCIIGGTQSAETSVYVNVPITGIQRDSPIVSEISILENVAFSFSCLTSAGRPGATVQWFRDPGNGTEIEIPGAVQVIEPAGTLSVTRSMLNYTATDRDTGYEIYCKAYNIGPSTSHASTRTTVNVLYPPTINPILNRAVIASLPLTIICAVTPGIPIETSYRWTRSTDNWAQDGQTLRFPSVTQIDAAEYTCTAWNVITPTGGLPVNGTDRETLTVNVLYPPVINHLQNRDVIVSTPLTVVCSITPGNPPETAYRWTRSSDNWSQDTQTLTFPSVTQGDAAVYTCTAWNVMSPNGGSAVNGIDTKTFTANVLYPPVIQALPDKDIELLSPLSVQCITSPGNPTETFYRWTRSTDQWSQETQTMSITRVKMSDAGNYTCTAWNVMVPTGGAQVEGRDSETYHLNPVCASCPSAKTSGQFSTGAVAGWVVAGIEAVVIALLTIYFLRRRQLCRQKTEGCKEEQDVSKQQQHKEQGGGEHYKDIGSSAAASPEGINDASRNEYEDLDSALRQETPYSAMGAPQGTRDAGPEYLNMETYNN